MIPININKIELPENWLNNAKILKHQLMQKDEVDRAEFIELSRKSTWGNKELVAALASLIGYKCWYSEVDLTGADPNVDHFRPKGKVRDVDIETHPPYITKSEDSGYWWLAFDFENYRLSCQHSNQRRVEMNNEGGKWDFFPVSGPKAPPDTACERIDAHECAIALDPCSNIDVKLLNFDGSGNPICANDDPIAMLRVRVSIWLYNLNKATTRNKRSAVVKHFKALLRSADIQYKIWQEDPQLSSKNAEYSFNQSIHAINTQLEVTQEFTSAKRCAARLALLEYPWIEDYVQYK